jgi:KUP system potassium uptake protein
MAHPGPGSDDDVYEIKADHPEPMGLGGVYNTRSLARAHKPVDGRRSGSQDAAPDDASDIEDADEGWLREDGRKKQVFKGTTLLWYCSPFYLNCDIPIPIFFLSGY